MTKKVENSNNAETQALNIPVVSNSLPSQEDIKKAISAIRQTYNDLVDGDTFPIDEFSSVALNLKYALRKLGNDC